MENISYLSIQDSLFQIAGKLDKAKAIYELWGQNLGMEKGELTLTDGMYFVSSHNTNCDIYCAISEYLYDSIKELDSTTKAFKELWQKLAEQNNVVQR